ncbi:hypothetical protein [Nisaea denitrificans]|uniref:hypothetical protein n=1 Tax=Nisaea denitrificans TaxID=390877 RepID=UPI00041C93CF|nr:hypothetical protein [Nisaea denitrificans]
MHKIENEIAAPACPPGHDRAAVTDIEVTAEMIWAALEEWSGFDEARNELEPLFARVYRAMVCARRNTGINPATIACAD